MTGSSWFPEATIACRGLKAARQDRHTKARAGPGLSFWESCRRGWRRQVISIQVLLPHRRRLLCLGIGEPSRELFGAQIQDDIAKAVGTEGVEADVQSLGFELGQGSP